MGLTPGMKITDIKIDKVFVVADVGRIVDPINFDNHVKGGVVWGLGHAMNSEISQRNLMRFCVIFIKIYIIW